jgi:hypothetical protein
LDADPPAQGVKIARRNTSGFHFVELDQSNDTTQAIKPLATLGHEWNAAGMGDFDGDGYADILIQADTASARDLGILINQSGNGWVFKDLGPILGGLKSP